MGAWCTGMRLLFLALCGIAVGLALDVREGYAEDAKSPIFAIIDVQKVLRDSSAIKGLNQEIEKRRDSYQEQLRLKEEELRNADQELTRQRTILGPEVFAQKRQELERKVGMLQREVQERKRALDQSFAKGLSQVQSELAVVAKDIAEAKGLDLILSKATVVIVKPEYEVTDEASKLLNERLPVVTVAFPNE
jgi:Skp family chaperone for outer membrane proteins